MSNVPFVSQNTTPPQLLRHMLTMPPPRRNPGRISHKRISDMICKSGVNMPAPLRRLLDAHNALFADQPRNYPGRVKGTEWISAQILCDLWSQQTAIAVAGGAQVVTNVVWVNNQALSRYQRSASTGIAHLAKLAFAKIILAEEDNCTKCWKSKLDGSDPEARGFGWRPLKRWHGTKHNYELLLNPELLPIRQLHECGVHLHPVWAFEEVTEEQKQAHDALNDGIADALFSADKARKSGHKEEQQEAINKEIKTEAAPLRGMLSVFGNESDAKQEPTPEPEAQHPETKGAGAAAGIGVDAGELTARLIHRLVDSHNVLEECASRMLRAYEQKLIPAMQLRNRNYEAPDELNWKIAHKKAVALLAMVDADALTMLFGRLMLTIERMAATISRRQSATYFVPAPATWFDLDARVNILGAEKRYLKAYEAGAEELKAKREAAKPASWDGEKEMVLAKTDNILWLAYHFKLRFMEINPKDKSLPYADIRRWAMSLRQIMGAGVGVERITEVAKWLFTSRDEDAVYWRETIRSTSGLRKCWDAIHAAYMLGKVQETPGAERSASDMGGRKYFTREEAKARGINLNKN
jgi:hypothetical protein